MLVVTNGYVLKSTKLSREPKQILNIFTEKYGIISAFSNSKFKLEISIYQCYQFEIILRNEGLNNLQKLTAIGTPTGVIELKNSFALSYLNEISSKLLPNNQDIPLSYLNFANATTILITHPSSQHQVISESLRMFEYSLIHEIGTLINFHADIDDNPILPQAFYLVDNKYNLLLTASPNQNSIKGKTLIAITKNDFKDSDINHEAKKLAQVIFKYYLNGKSLNSLKTWQESKEYL